MSPEKTPRPVAPHDEMACVELVEVITDYLEDNLGERDRRRFEAHLAECPWCVNYLEQMRQTIAALGDLRADSLSPERQEELLQAFRGWRDR